MAWHEHQPFSGVPVGDVPVGATVEADFSEVLPDHLIPEWNVVEER